MTSFAEPLQFDDDTVAWEWENEDVACPTVEDLADDDDDASYFSAEFEDIEEREDIESDDIP